MIPEDAVISVSDHPRGAERHGRVSSDGRDDGQQRKCRAGGMNLLS